MPIQATERSYVGAPFGDRKDPKLDGVRALDKALPTCARCKSSLIPTVVPQINAAYVLGDGSMYCQYCIGVGLVEFVESHRLQSANAVNSQAVEISEGSAKA